MGTLKNERKAGIFTTKLYLQNRNLDCFGTTINKMPTAEVLLKSQSNTIPVSHFCVALNAA